MNSINIRNDEAKDLWLNTSLEQVRYLLQRQHLVPTILLALAALSILVSIFFPYWRMELEAPQYPDGLNIELYVNKAAGDIGEIDGLNHYIGMRPLQHAATLERTLSIFVIIAMGFVVTGAIFVYNKWAVLLTLPVLTYPLIFIADLYFWLRTFGQNLDPSAALSSSVEPFTQPIVGSKAVANFVSTGILDVGFYLACLAAVFVIIGLYFHRKIYKPMITLPQDAYSTRNFSIMKLELEAKKKGVYSSDLMEHLRQKYCELCKKDRVDEFSMGKLIENAKARPRDQA